MQAESYLEFKQLRLENFQTTAQTTDNRLKWNTHENKEQPNYVGLIGMLMCYRDTVFN